MFFRRLAALALVAALAACSGGSSRIASAGGASPAAVQLVTTELPPPERSDLAAGVRPYYVGPYDTLTIDVFGIEELKERDVQVDAAGEISFPLAGTVNVGGRTPKEVKEIIEQRLVNSYVRDPQVTVNLKEVLSQVVTVNGQVSKPGQFPVIGHMTLMRAIAQAGGASEFAKLDEVVIFRTVNGQNMAALYDVRAIERGNYADPEIYANDVIVVGDSKSRRLFKDFMGIVPLLTTPLVILLQ